jgi:hypothetical protein
MNLDVNTLLTLMLVNVFAMAVAVPVVMGWRVSSSARFVVGSAVSQALAWGSFLLALPVHDRAPSTLWVGLPGTSFVLMWLALRGWLGPRPGARCCWWSARCCPSATASASATTHSVSPGRLGLGLPMGMVCLARAWPAPGTNRRWRGLIIVCPLAGPRHLRAGRARRLLHRAVPEPAQRHTRSTCSVPRSTTSR